MRDCLNRSMLVLLCRQHNLVGKLTEDLTTFYGLKLCCKNNFQDIIFQMFLKRKRIEVLMSYTLQRGEKL